MFAFKIFATFSNSAMSEKTRLRKSKSGVVVIFQTDAETKKETAIFPTLEMRIKASWYLVEEIKNIPKTKYH